MVTLPKVRADLSVRVFRLAYETKDNDIRLLSFLVSALNPTIESLEKALNTCDIEKIVDKLTSIGADIRQIYDQLAKVREKLPPDLHRELTREIENIENEILKQAPEQIRTCSLRGLIR